MANTTRLIRCAAGYAMTNNPPNYYHEPVRLGVNATGLSTDCLDYRRRGGGMHEDETKQRVRKKQSYPFPSAAQQQHQHRLIYHLFIQGLCIKYEPIRIKQPRQQQHTVFAKTS